jgi:hypothetical protein
MAQWVTIWRAAQLMDVPRGVLQQRVQTGNQTTDGLVSTGLLALYPRRDRAIGHAPVSPGL